MSDRNLEAFEEARVKMLERNPDRIGRGTSLASIRDATWVHQQYALTHGYDSVLELAIDELAAEITELKLRMDALEAQLAGQV